MNQDGEITVLLREWRAGRQDALDELMPLVYPRLRTIAAAYERRESKDLTLQATALVNEVYIRLLGQRRLGWEDREHFYSFAAQMMRLILADHARARLSAKRGGHAVRVPLHDELPWVSVAHDEILTLNTALDELAQVDATKVRLIELRYFLGCTAQEVATVCNRSKATVDRELQIARAWLFRRLSVNGPAASS